MGICLLVSLTIGERKAERESNVKKSHSLTSLSS